MFGVVAFCLFAAGCVDCKGEQSNEESSAPSARPELPDGAQRVHSISAGEDSGRRLEFFQVPAEAPPLCDLPKDLLVQFLEDERVVEEHRFESSCEGACTEEERKEGERRLETTKKRIEKGKSQHNELDHNFTKCFTLEHIVRRELRGLSRPVVLIESQRLGAHSVVDPVVRLVTYGCGGLQISETFRGWGMYSSPSRYRGVRAVAGDGDSADENFQLRAPETRNPEKLDAGDFDYVPLADASFSVDDCEWNIERPE